MTEAWAVLPNPAANGNEPNTYPDIGEQIEGALHCVGDGEEGVLALLEHSNEQDSAQESDHLHDYLNRDKATDNASASN